MLRNKAKLSENNFLVKMLRFEKIEFENLSSIHASIKEAY